MHKGKVAFPGLKDVVTFVVCLQPSDINHQCDCSQIKMCL